MLFFKQIKKWIIQGNNHRCLDCNPITKEMFVNKCNAANRNMLWEFGTYNRTALEHFDQNGAKSV